MDSNKATIHRYVTTLENLRYIEKNEHDQFQITYKYKIFGTKGLFEFQLIDLVKPYMEELVLEVNESAFIATYREDYVYYLGKIECPSALRIVVEPGKSAPLYCVASGKLFLAHLKRDEFESYLERQPLQAISENTITSKEKMRIEVEKVKNQGFAIDFEEWEKYLLGIAAPIYDFSGSLVASLCIAGVSYRFTPEKIDQVVSKLIIVASHISKLLNYEKKEGVH